jgi:hypothetical protein
MIIKYDKCCLCDLKLDTDSEIMPINYCRIIQGACIQCGKAYLEGASWSDYLKIQRIKELLKKENIAQDIIEKCVK